eukprot:8114695-Pyramimonas_sp.AAC.1
MVRRPSCSAVEDLTLLREWGRRLSRYFFPRGLGARPVHVVWGGAPKQLPPRPYTCATRVINTPVSSRRVRGGAVARRASSPAKPSRATQRSGYKLNGFRCDTTDDPRALVVPSWLVGWVSRHRARPVAAGALHKYALGAVTVYRGRYIALHMRDAPARPPARPSPCGRC